METAAEADIVWNLVFTPHTFRYFHLFTRSLLAMSDARARLVANGCTRDEVARMHALSEHSGGRVTAMAFPGSQMRTHGQALNALFDGTDDGELFCFVDTDVKATDRFMPRLLAALDGAVGVTSCKPAWATDTTVPAGAVDLVGRHFVSPDGFVYGSSYLAMYRRASVADTRNRWAVSFDPCVFSRLSPAVRARLDEMGRRFDMYDTAKVLNILLQGDGGTLRHLDHPELFHVGGISEYLSHPRDEPPPLFARGGAGRTRWDFAHWAAATLMAFVDGGTPPDAAVPGLAEAQAMTTQNELRDLVERYG
jgi:hypothetical protein